MLIQVMLNIRNNAVDAMDGSEVKEPGVMDNDKTKVLVIDDE